MNGNINRYFERKDKENAMLEKLNDSLASVIDRQERQAQILSEYIARKEKAL